MIYKKRFVYWLGKKQNSEVKKGINHGKEIKRYGGKEIHIKEIQLNINNYLMICLMHYH
jgi:hypothetical protein